MACAGGVHAWRRVYNKRYVLDTVVLGMNGDSDEEELFRREMGGVTRLEAPGKVSLKKAAATDLQLQARRRAAVSEQAQDANFLSTTEIDLLDPFYPLEYKREGVQHGVFRKLKQGKYEIEARLDLHRMTVEQARNEVYDFVREAMTLDLRTVMIVHGKGRHAESQGAVLKSYINYWLPQLDMVQAFCSAQPRHGGVGAVYVLLRKSERQKQENRDRLSKGRVQ